VEEIDSTGSLRRTGAAGSADFPVKKPRIFAKRDCLGTGLFSDWWGLRAERRGVRLPRREGRREPLGEYSDDMIDIVFRCVANVPTWKEFPMGRTNAAVELLARHIPLIANA
jgi:hypothetical protein